MPLNVLSWHGISRHSPEDVKLNVHCRDLPLLTDPSVALSAFAQLPKGANGSVAVDTLSSFMNQYFGQAGR